MEWIWRDELWFPTKDGVPKWTWKDLENKPDASVYYPKVDDLHWSLLLGIGLIVVRLILNKLLVEPLGYKMGVSKRKIVQATSNPVLEKAYKHNSKFSHQVVQNLAKQTDMKERQIQVWLRRRQCTDAPAPIKKFEDCGWHFTFYGIAFICGVSVLWKKPWLWKTIECWNGWPHQSVTTDIYWYYIIELSFYWSLVFTLVTDHRRKDFVEMIVHHVATIVLIYFSWMMNFVRIGTLVLVVHDAADPWLALAKMFNYCKKPALKEAVFVGFIIVWIISRLWFYPFVVLYSSTIEPYHAGLIETTFFTHWFFNFFLYILMVLHLMWSYSIGKIILNKLTRGKVEDIRSDSDDIDDSDSEEDEHIHKNGNGRHHENEQ